MKILDAHSAGEDGIITESMTAELGPETQERAFVGRAPKARRRQFGKGRRNSIANLVEHSHAAMLTLRSHLMQSGSSAFNGASEGWDGGLRMELRFED